MPLSQGYITDMMITTTNYCVIAISAKREIEVQQQKWTNA
jgi:hypothetical protein